MNEQQEFICDCVADGLTLREIAYTLGMSAGNVLRIATHSPEATERYTRAREAAADLFEAGIMEVAENASAATAKADRVKLTAYQWLAARRAPKRYGDRVQQDHTSSDGSMTPQQVISTSDPMEAAKLYAEMMGKG